MRLGSIVLLLVLGFAGAPHAEAQRRARASAELPIDAQLFTGGSAHEFRLSISARSEVELTADLRLLHLEVRTAGARRGLACDSPARPRRIDPATVRTLHAGEVWSETFDVRTLCWGRALVALEAGGEVSGSFGTARGRAGVAIARMGETTFRAAPFAALAVPAASTPTPPAGDVRVTLAPADAASGARVSLRVTIRAVRPVRAWVRPDRVRFRVRSPDGTTHTCAMSRSDGAPIPDLFARVSARSGPVLSLDARAYCTARVFAAAGIYEVTPLLDLDVDGRGWHFDTPRGTFEGAPVPVRIRSAIPAGAR